MCFELWKGWRCTENAAGTRREILFRSIEWWQYSLPSEVISLTTPIDWAVILLLFNTGFERCRLKADTTTEFWWWPRTSCQPVLPPVLVGRQCLSILSGHLALGINFHVYYDSPTLNYTTRFRRFNKFMSTFLCSRTLVSDSFFSSSCLRVSHFCSETR